MHAYRQVQSSDKERDGQNPYFMNAVAVSVRSHISAAVS